MLRRGRRTSFPLLTTRPATAPLAATCSRSRQTLAPSPATAPFAVALAAILTVLAARPAPAAQPAQKNNKRTVEVETTVTTEDGWRLPLTYYSADNKDAPVVILLHMQGDSRLVWKRNRFAEPLVQNEFAVITVDLRRHGEAKDARGAGAGELSPRDYQGMYLDLEAVKQFIFDEHQKQKLNMAKTAVVAPGMSAPVALNWAAADWLKKPYNDAPTLAAMTPRGQDVKAIVLLSPESSVPGVSATRAMRVLRDPAVNCAVLICYGEMATGDEKTAKDLHRQLASRRGGEMQTLIQGLPTPARGTDLLGRNQQVDALIRGFLAENTQKLDIPWRDRRSRLQRLE